MIKQESFKNELPTLYLVATPIGNLEEMTPRAISVLREVDIVAAEDTRHAGILMSHFGIKTKMISHHAHNEKESAKGILELFKSHNKIALISDAGYPLISDPGQTLVKDVIAEGYNVVPISGSSAFLNALVASGLVTQKFAFMGFLEAKETALRKQLEQDKAIPLTLVYYLSVHKLEKSLEIMYNVLGNRQIVLARELTKLHEEFIRGSVSEVIENLGTLKGEFVLVVDQDREEKEVNFPDLVEEVRKECDAGVSVSRAISVVAKRHNVPKNALYAFYHEEAI